MSKWAFLEKYIFEPNDENRFTSKHSFFNVNEAEIIKAEKRIGMAFPEELRQFYLQVGYGFLCRQDKNFIDRIMDPSSVADFILGEERYEYDECREMIDREKKMAFFEISEGSYLSLDLSKKDDKGACPILYFQDEVADSLENFIRKMDEEIDYYINY